MGYKLFRDRRCVICGKPAVYYSDITGKYYCNEHSNEGNPIKVPKYDDEKDNGAHKFRWGKNEKFTKPKFQHYR